MSPGPKDQAVDVFWSEKGFILPLPVPARCPSDCLPFALFPNFPPCLSGWVEQLGGPRSEGNWLDSYFLAGGNSVYIGTALVEKTKD